MVVSLSALMKLFAYGGGAVKDDAESGERVPTPFTEAPSA